MSGVEFESALLVAVPAAEAAVGAHRARLDPSARDGVPAHLTVLYPFLPPAEIGPGVLAELTRIFAGLARFSFTLDQVRWFGDSVVWLGPSDEGPFRALTELVAGAYPACSPYGGVYADVVPHLTIGQVTGPGGPAGHVGLAGLRAAAGAVGPLLPISADATEVTLMAGPPPGQPGPPGQWQNVASFPLG